MERDAIALTNPLWPRRTNITLPAYSEEHVRQRLFLEMALPLNECGLGDVIVGDIGKRRASASSSSSTSGAGAVQNELLPRGFKYAICKSDLFSRDDVGAFSVGEAKTSVSVAELSHNARSVVAAYTAIVRNEQSRCGSESMTVPIAQLHGYMVQQQCRYGLITTYDMTWFFKIVATLSSNNSYAIPRRECGCLRLHFRNAPVSVICGSFRVHECERIGDAACSALRLFRYVSVLLTLSPAQKNAVLPQKLPLSLSSPPPLYARTLIPPPCQPLSLPQHGH